ncbi:hypothetical protein [Legionella rowbothamii]|uniref:hypothetical protein n=1 Tax=Legionella rowbothamii TaxID=96229 RepID=UPI001F5FA6F7|nr:hypothetical protein [Legionella rowbothamii]
MMMDAPPINYVTSPSTIQLQHASNPNLNEEKRSVMIDRLIADDAEPDLVPKLLTLYNETDNIEVENTIVQDLMLYNQRHQSVQSYMNNVQPLLKSFFSELLDVKTLTPRMADDALRGYIDTHSPEEIIAQQEKINKRLKSINHYSSIMLKYTLIYKSKELQGIYLRSIVNELRKENNADLDSYFFGPMTLSFNHTGKSVIEPEYKQIVIKYLKEVRGKYTQKGIKAHPEDFHRSITAPYYFGLMKDMGM